MSTRDFESYSVVGVVLAVKLALVVPIVIGTSLATGPVAADASVTLVGCLRQGPDKGTFLLDDRPVMSTIVGLTAHVGHRVSVRGEQGVNKRYGSVFKIKSLKMLEGSCG